MQNKALRLSFLLLAYTVLFLFYKRVQSAAIRNEALRRQETVAADVAGTIYDFVSMYKTKLVAASQVEGLCGMDPTLQQKLLNGVLQQDAFFLELSVFDLTGQETLRVRRFLGTAAQMRNFADQVPFQAALQKGEYVGALERFEGLYPSLTLAVPIYQRSPNQQAVLKGVLLGKLNLSRLSQLLGLLPKHGYQAAIVAGTPLDSFLVAHSNPSQIDRRDARLPEEILRAILAQTADKGGGKIVLEDGTAVLGAYASVKDLDWVVYIQQPMNTAFAAAGKDVKMVNIKGVALGLFFGVLVILPLALRVRIPPLRGKISYPSRGISAP